MVAVNRPMGNKVFFYFVFLFITATAQANVVQISSGKISGNDLGDLNSYLGIPYAAPPIGDLRWKAPTLAATWTGVRQTSDYGSNCLQRSLLSPAVLLEGNEDCLYLNIWAPKNQKKLPVMVFIHGGAYLIGGANQLALGSPYDGEHIARNHNVIVVTINYRLGVLGFTVHPDLKKESATGAEGNYGLLDAIAALQWVQNNIGNFGGDPTNVMVFGESAGAMMTGGLIAAPLAKGLFAKAGLESGFYEIPKASDRYQQGLDLAQKYNCDHASDAIKCLREVPADTIVLDQSTLFDLFNFTINPNRYFDVLPYGIVVDGVTLPRTPVEQVKAGEHNKVPVIIGTNKSEASLFMEPGKFLTCGDFETAVKQGAGANAANLLKHFPCGIIARSVADQMLTDMFFLCPTRRMANALSTHNDVYRYRFSYQIVGPLGIFGPTHFTEVPLIFGNLLSVAIAPLPSTLSLSSDMQAYWAQFAKNSSPSFGKSNTWAKYIQPKESTLEFDSESTQIQDLEKAHCDYLDQLVN